MLLVGLGASALLFLILYFLLLPFYSVRINQFHCGLASVWLLSVVCAACDSLAPNGVSCCIALPCIALCRVVWCRCVVFRFAPDSSYVPCIALHCIAVSTILFLTLHIPVFLAGWRLCELLSKRYYFLCEADLRQVADLKALLQMQMQQQQQIPPSSACSSHRRLTSFDSRESKEEAVRFSALRC